MLLSKSMESGLLPIVNDIECWTKRKVGRGGRRDEEDGGPRRKEGRGGGRYEEERGEGGMRRAVTLELISV